MGRAENRKMKKHIKSKMTEEQFKVFQSEVNQEYVNGEVNKQIKFYQELWTDCLLEAFKKNGYSTDKAKMILDDVELIMLRKIEEKKKNNTGRIPVIKGRL
ncbi:hypothetical protein [uncultured Clostridium sp.]|uniref:hypothetical protein n=1 Tax=uncultured Clostridium sp. TaxID=59620 RepID=UPI0025F14456|nr:hypothetical protein [uncultured Clostridium sp.]